MPFEEAMCVSDKAKAQEEKIVFLREIASYIYLLSANIAQLTLR